MRDWLLIGVLVAVLPFAARHTWIGVLLWNWVSLMNPHRLTFGFAYVTPFAAIAAGATFLSMLITRDKLKMPWDRTVIVLLLLVLWMCISTVLAIDRSASWVQLVKVLKIQLMVLVALAALHSRKHIEWFVWVNILSIGYYGFKGGIFTISTGGAGRVWGPAGSFIEDNNELAVALVMCIPMMYFLRAVATRPALRHFLMLLMLLCALSALGTQSRGALLAISAMGLLLWFRLKNKIVAGLTIAAVATALVSFMPTSWDERMGTIQNYEQDASASARLFSWRMTINLANDRPWGGGGFAIYSPEVYARYLPESPHTQAAHSIYFSMLGEHGYVGLGLFVLLLALTFLQAGKMRRIARQNPETMWVYMLASMCQVSLIGYMVGGAFLSLAYFDLPYNIVVMLIVANRWMAEKGWLKEPTGPFGSAAPDTSPAGKTPPLQVSS